MSATGVARSHDNDGSHPALKIKDLREFFLSSSTDSTMPRFPGLCPLESVMAHIRLNTHPSQGGQAAPPVVWGARDPKIRGPVVGTVGDPGKRNAMGGHSGSYGIYRALAIAAQEQIGRAHV